MMSRSFWVEFFRYLMYKIMPSVNRDSLKFLYSSFPLMVIKHTPPQRIGNILLCIAVRSQVRNLLVYMLYQHLTSTSGWLLLGPKDKQRPERLQNRNNGCDNVS
jgi:hypothetical protein